MLTSMMLGLILNNENRVQCVETLTKTTKTIFDKKDKTKYKNVLMIQNVMISVLQKRFDLGGDFFKDSVFLSVTSIRTNLHCSV